MQDGRHPARIQQSVTGESQSFCDEDVMHSIIFFSERGPKTERERLINNGGQCALRPLLVFPNILAVKIKQDFG